MAMRSRGPRRLTEWGGVAWNQTAITAGANKFVIASDTLLQVVSGQPTLVRTLGTMAVSLTPSSSVAAARAEFWCGITAIHSGVEAAEADPRTHIDSDHWVWTGFLLAQYTSGQMPVYDSDSNTALSASSYQPFGDNLRSCSFDVSAMRKILDAGEIALRIYAEFDGASDASLTGFCRYLLKV